jgi:adenylate kinase family enzyme
MPIVPYYEKQGVVKTVDGMQGIDEVSQSIYAILD